MNRLEQAVSTYKAALNALPKKGDSDTAARIMKLLIARDDVARALIENHCQSASTLLDICALDEKFERASVTIDELAGRATLVSWRQSVHPLESSWWWNLDERAAAAERGHNPLWTIPAALLFVLSLSVIADTITTLRNGGLNRLSVFGTLMQTVLALIAGSTFLTGGREWLEKLFAKMNINRKFQGGSRVLLAASVLALTLGISLLLPNLVARYRNHEGDRFFQNKQYADAVQNYQQAVALEPSFVKAHFNLALACDKARDYSNAMREYELTLGFDSKNYIAANNLARLYVLQAKNYDGALRILDSLIANLVDVPIEIHYYLYKNRGWAYLELHNLAQAEGDLFWALKKQDGAAAYYLLGRVYEEQGRIADAKNEWDHFIQLATKASPSIAKDDRMEYEFEPNWLAYAHEQLLKGDAK